MLGTNQQFDALVGQMDRQIGGLERALLDGKATTTAAPALEELWAKRRAVKLLLLNRRIEAAKRVVDFNRWRDGDGALYLCTGSPAAKRRQAG